MKIDYSNMPDGSKKYSFIIRYILNICRTWYFFHIKYPWVQYHGFVRVMAHTRFAKREIELGNNVQFGKNCSIAANLKVHNDVLFAGKVSFVGGNDHTYNIPGRTIWDSPRGKNKDIVIEDDVWVGNGCTLMGGITIGKGSIVAAGAIVTKDIPPCEIWGGVPAKKIKDRFKNEDDKQKHLNYLNTRYAQISDK